MVRASAACLAALLLGGASVEAAPERPRGPLVPESPAPRSCVHETGELAGVVTLDGDCVYEQSFTIGSSNTTLDCDGAKITGGKGRSITIVGEIENVTVKNCYVEQARGLRVAPPERAPGETDDALRLRSPKKIVIRNVKVSYPISTGLFIGPHVVGTVVEDSIFEGAASAGIYLEYGSQRVTLRNNLLRRNGHVDPQGRPRIGWVRREGVAVDASAENLIVGNRFEGNAFGGILLYKNCWEYHSTQPKQRQRVQHAHSNVIHDNTFVEMPIGVWVAARQARDLGTWDCGDETPYENPIPLAEAFPADYPAFGGTYPAPYDYQVEYLMAELEGRECPDDDCSPERTVIYLWPDYAEDNTIEGNRFEKITIAGVRVEDDGTTISGNHFVGDFDYVYLGTPFRARYLGHPVRDTLIADNTFEGVDQGRTFADQLAVVPGEHEGTTIEGNRRVDAPADAGPVDAEATDASTPDAGATDASAPGDGDQGSDGCAVGAPTAPTWTLPLLLLLLLSAGRRR